MTMADDAARSRLGRGLAALIGDVGDESAAVERARGGQRRVPIEFLRANPRNPRRTFAEEELSELLKGYGYHPYFVAGDDPEKMHQTMAATLDKVIAEIKGIQQKAREGGDLSRPIWPMIVLRTPKGWTGPKTVDGLKTEGSWRSHQVPMGDMDKPEHITLLEEWMKSYRPEELFDEDGRLIAELAALPPEGVRRLYRKRKRRS